MFLQPSKFKVNQLKHAQVITIFLKCAKRRFRRKIWKIRQILKVSISVMAKRIWLKIGMECILPRGIFHCKNGAVLFRHYQVTDVWKWHFLGSCIIHTCLLHTRTGCTWLHDTLDFKGSKQNSKKQWWQLLATA